MVKLRVLASGAAADVQVRTSSGFALLDEAALKYLRGARFVPARDRSGLPVDSLVVVPMRFVLED
jgi:protein TonB